MTVCSRNSPLVLAEAKSIYDLYDTGHKYITPSGEPDKGAYRNAPIVLVEPKTIYNIEDTGSKFITPSGEPDNTAFRSRGLYYFKK